MSLADIWEGGCTQQLSGRLVYG